MVGSRIRRFCRGSFSRAMALVLAGALTVTSFSVPVAAGEEYSSLTTETQMASEPEVVKVKKYNASLRDQLFNDNWKFQEGDESGAEAVAYDDSGWETVQLPHDYSVTKEFTASGEAESGYLLGGIGWYRKSFNIPEGAEDKRVNINFDGVYMDSTIYVNGTQVGYHPYGYSPFSVDITDALNREGVNVLAVRVNHQVPSSRWYSGSGILRNVHLILTDPVHITYNGMKVEPDLDAQKVTIKTELQNEGEATQKVTTTYTVFPKGGAPESAIGTFTTKATSVEPGATAIVTSSFDVLDPSAWSVESPTLYTVRAEVKTVEGGTLLDTYDVTTGFRSLGYDTNEGFSLNGQKLKLKGVSMHHDQGALGGISAPAAISRQIDILKNMGVNAIRVTHNPASEDLIRLAEEKGMLLIEEMFDGWQKPKNSNSKDYSRFFEQTVSAPSTQEGIVEEGMTWAEYDLKQTIRRGYNSPAIIQWSLGNEVSEGTSNGSMSAYSSQQANLIRWAQETDTTRKVTRGDNKIKDGQIAAVNLLNSLSEAGGVVGVNYVKGAGYDQYHRQHPDWLIEGSETASSVNSRGVYNRTSDSGRTSDKRLTSYDHSAVNWGDYASSAWYDVMTRDFVMGEFVWTGFDYIGEPTHWNGLTSGAQGSWPSPKNSYFGIVDTAGFPKDSYYLYQSQWNDAVHTIHILPAWNESVLPKNHDNVSVVVYSDAKAVELFFTNESGERQSLGKKEFTTKMTDAGYTYQIYEGEDRNRSEHQNLYLTWTVPWAPGKLEAVGYDAQGNVIEDAQGRRSVETTGQPAKLVMHLNRESVEANNADYVYAEVSVVDKNGVEVPDAANEVTFSVDGVGYLAGTDNGEQADHTSYQSAQRHAFSGKVLGIVGSTDETGAITITASSPGLQSATATLQSTAVLMEDPSVKTVDAYRYPRNYVVKVGHQPLLPEKVEVIYSDKSTGEARVTWDEIAPDAYQKAGTFQLQGKSEFGDMLTVNITMIETLGAILNYSTTTSIGQVPTLPSTRPGVLVNGKVLQTSFPVNWELPEDSAYDTEGIVEVKGNTTVFDKPYEVTASVRVQEQTMIVGANLAPNVMELKQDIPEAKQSDNLQAIIDGSIEAGSNPFGGSNKTLWSNYDNSNPEDGSASDDTAEITFTYATKQVFSEFTVYFHEDSYSARYPEAGSTQFEVSDSEQGPWEPVTATEEIGGAKNGVKAYTYRLNAPVSATVVKVKVKNNTEVLQKRNPCTSITEIQLKQADSEFVTFGSVGFEELHVNGVAVSQSALNAWQYATEAQRVVELTYVPLENAAVTVLPVYEGVSRLIVESEDHQKRETFEIVLGQAVIADPGDASRDYDVLKTHIEVGNQQPDDYKEKALDGKFNTMWHTVWGKGLVGDQSIEKDGWSVLIADESVKLDGLRYYSRADGPNGRILDYVVYASNTDDPQGQIMEDGTRLPSDDQYEEVARGTWTDEGGWKAANFRQPMLAKYVKLVPQKTGGEGSQSNIFVSAAELRLRMAPVKMSLNDAALDYTVTVSPERVEVKSVDATHPAMPESIEVKDKEGHLLTEGVDYTVTIEDNTEEGTATITITGINTHEGVLTKSYDIEVIPEETDKPGVSEPEISSDETTEDESTEDEPTEEEPTEESTTEDSTSDVVSSNDESLESGSEEDAETSDTADGSEGSEDAPQEEESVEPEVTTPDEPTEDIGEALIRYDGRARQDVAVRVAQAYFEDAKRVILVQNLAFADALSANNIAKGEMPILYTAQDSIPAVTLEELKRVDRDEIFLVGGPATISEGVETQLQEEGFKVTRIGGDDRFEVNAKTAAYWPEARSAVVASGLVYSDALSAAPYAYAMEAPILLTTKDTLPERQREIITGLHNVVVVGGQKSVSSHVFNIIHGEVNAHIVRIAGADRYEVSSLVAERLPDNKRAILASGEVWSDALVAGPVAQKLGAPILLTCQNELPDAIQTALEVRHIQQVLVLGGLKSVGDVVEDTARLFIHER